MRLLDSEGQEYTSGVSVRQGLQPPADGLPLEPIHRRTRPSERGAPVGASPTSLRFEREATRAAVLSIWPCGRQVWATCCPSGDLDSTRSPFHVATEHLSWPQAPLQLLESTLL